MRFNGIVQAAQRAFSFLAPKPPKPQTHGRPVHLPGQRHLTPEMLRQQQDFEAKLMADPVYSQARRNRDKAKKNKKRFLHHEAAMRARLKEILDREKPHADS